MTAQTYHLGLHEVESTPPRSYHLHFQQAHAEAKALFSLECISMIIGIQHRGQPFER
jgi:hypothetical protein